MFEGVFGKKKESKVEGTPEAVAAFEERVRALHPEARPEDVAMTANALAVSFAESGEVADKAIEDKYEERLIARPEGSIKGKIGPDSTVEVTR